jgi:hypothetical protein
MTMNVEDIALKALISGEMCEANTKPIGSASELSGG